MDLKKLDVVAGANAGSEVQLKHPVTRQPIGIFWKLLGSDSDAYRAALAEQNQRALQRAATSAGQGTPRTLAEIRADEISLLSACVTGWQDEAVKEAGCIDVGGTMLSFSRDAAVKTMTEYPWIREQVDTEVHNRGNFLRG